ncbi:MAG: response regulator [Deltaproteobacteria bacterium]|nr:response regulator [Deltaproteobacteria bacterium]
MIDTSALTGEMDGSFNGLHVLMADDSTTTRRVFQARLEELGITVTPAEDGEDALSKIEAHPQKFDIIFCDIQMPRMNGYELCRKLNESPWFEGTPIVMVSTCSDAREVIKALKLGADDFIPKPFERDLLIKVIKRVRA